MLEHVGLKVNRLIRMAYGPFQLGILPKRSVEEVPAKVLREQIGALVELPPRPRRPAPRRRGAGEPADHRRPASRPADRGAGRPGHPPDQRPGARGAVRDPGAWRAAPARQPLPRPVRRQRCRRPRGGVARCRPGPVRRPGESPPWPRSGATSRRWARASGSRCCAPTPAGWARRRTPFDIVFLDPPYGSGLAAAGAGRPARSGLAGARAPRRGRGRARATASTRRRAWRSRTSVATAPRGSLFLRRSPERPSHTWLASLTRRHLARWGSIQIDDIGRHAGGNSGGR